MTASPIVRGFLAGFVAVLVFHQVALGLLHLAGITPGTPWRVAPVPPFGVPAMLSAAFWGGLWGILFVLLVARLGWGASLTAGLFFGAVAPTLVAWFVVLPLKGLPAGGFTWPGIIVGPLVNGAWGLGTALLLRLTGGKGRPALAGRG
jgi:hypothetical protein